MCISINFYVLLLTLSIIYILSIYIYTHTNILKKNKANPLYQN